MAQILDIGGDYVFDALVYGEQHPGTMQYLQQQAYDWSSSVGNSASRFAQETREFYDRYFGQTAQRMLRAAKRAVGTVWQVNEIRPISTMEDFQSAPPIMQRYIMAEPTVRKMFIKQQIEGYDEKYQDPFPNDTWGPDQYDYRRVTNGIVEFREDDSWYSNTYMEELLPDDRELVHEEQLDILNTWENVVDLVRKGEEDPTSRFGSYLP